MHYSFRHKDTADVSQLSDRKQRIYKFLTESPLGVLSTVDSEGNPHGSVVYITVNKHFQIGFLTKADTLKYQNLINHPAIMLTVFDPESQTTAEVIGRATEVSDGYEINAIAGHVLRAALNTSRVGVPPISKLQAGPYVAFIIEPAQIRIAVYGRPDPGNYNELFDAIESFDLETP